MASMFNKIKHLKDLRSQGKQLQSALAEESVTLERKGITLVMDGNQSVKSLTIPPNMPAGEIAAVLPGLFNDTNEKVKRIMAQKIQSMGGLPNLNP